MEILKISMEIIKISIEIIEMIVGIIKWIAEKLTRRPKITHQRDLGVETSTTTSLLSIALKPLEPFLILFTKHSIILLALLGVYGLMVKFQLDERIGIFFIGCIFAFAGAGNLVITQKDTENAHCLHYLLYTFSASILLFGILVSIGALLLMIAGVPVNPSGR